MMSGTTGFRRLLTAGGAVVAALTLFGLLAVYGPVHLSSAGSGRAAPTGLALSLAIDPGDGSLIRAGGGALSRSTNQGQSWQSLPIPDALKPDKLVRVATISAAPSSVSRARC